MNRLCIAGLYEKAPRLRDQDYFPFWASRVWRHTSSSPCPPPSSSATSCGSRSPGTWSTKAMQRILINSAYLKLGCTGCPAWYGTVIQRFFLYQTFLLSEKFWISNFQSSRISGWEINIQCIVLLFFLAVIFRHLNSEGFSVQGNCSAHFVPFSSVVEPFYFGPAPAPASQDGGSNSSSSCSCSPQFIVLKNLKNNFFNLPGLVLFTERHECFALLFQYFTLLKGTDKFYFTLL